MSILDLGSCVETLVGVCFGIYLSITSKLLDSIHLEQHLNLAPEISESRVETRSVPHISHVPMAQTGAHTTYGLG